ncbi:MAG: bifunctional nuclease family protein [Acidobacteriota bacterium]
MSERITLEVKGLMVDPLTNMPLVVLRAPDDQGAHVLPLWVGVFEANAIALQLEGVAPPRPMTHDLTCQLIEKLGAKVVEAVITEIRDSTFHANLVLEREGGERLVIDSRPSDALALALRSGAPIIASESMIEAAQALEPPLPDLDAVGDEISQLTDAEF